MTSVFVNATTARTDTRNASVIHSEVCSIETAVLANISAGTLYANVVNGTTMTDDADYYSAYDGSTPNISYSDQIATVRIHFEDLGYGVNILANTSTNANITWNISW